MLGRIMKASDKILNVPLAILQELGSRQASAKDTRHNK